VRPRGRFRRSFGAVVTVSVCLLSSFAVALPEEDVAIAFIAHCVLNAGRIDKVEAAARVFDYELLQPDQAIMLAPQDPNAYFKGWLVRKGQGAPYFLGVAEGVMNREVLSTCSVSIGEYDTDLIETHLRAHVNIGRLISEDRSGGQRWRLWDASAIAKGALISITDAKNLGLEGGTFSFSSPRQR